jgi:hypothetical protein
MKMKNKPRRKIRKTIASRNGLREILSDRNYPKNKRVLQKSKYTLKCNHIKPFDFIYLLF